MGFGLLLIGYLLLLPVSIGFFYSVPFGCIFLFWAGYKLRRVNVPFGRSLYFVISTCILSIVACCLRLLSEQDMVTAYLETATLVSLFLWHLFIFTGIEWVSVETGVQMLKVRSVRQKVCSTIYFLLAIFMNVVPSPENEEVLLFLTASAKAVILVGLVVLLVNSYLFFRTYMCICMPEDLDMKQKPSRFAFINKRRELQAEKEAKEQAYLLELKKQKLAKKRKKK